MKIHEKYILRCIQLGKNGFGTTFPNPMVGSVVVRGDTIIGEGFTDPFGGPHAEVNAINSVKDPSLLRGSTLYVTLEPCSHYGKTPPCADMIVRNRIPKVVIGITDPNEKVAGNGIRKLREAGCEVTVGVLEDACREHHKRFLCFMEKRRPYMILKWAESPDGFLAPTKNVRQEEPAPYWITAPPSRQLAHKWRGEEQAILVGTNTVLEDNPQLNLRTWYGRPPLRVILDRDLKIGPAYHVMDGSIPTLLLTQREAPKQKIPNLEYVTMDFERDLAVQICELLHKKSIISLLVEGGAQTLRTFMDSNLWDEARIFTGKSYFMEGLRAPSITGKLLMERQLVTDTLKIVENVKKSDF
ncbi:MAG: bifunctional diaminohydroxyphosphoribosylaminopyrimidine deaminase/5-amino-6-(5-phosphoribosylamino)uracil reductase RibD [Sediminicola sp.]